MVRRLAMAALLLSGCGLDRIVHELDPDCDCTQPDDICRDGACLQPESSCTATSGCAPPYLCNTDNGRCTCDPTPGVWEQCAPRCDADAPCPEDTVCDDESGLCVPPLQCLSDAVCAEGEACSEGQLYSTVIWDGNSGYFVSSGYTGSTCTEGPERTDRGCGRGEDCPEGDCIIRPDALSTCEATAICGPQEFRLDARDATCYVHLPCRYDADCPDPFVCRLFWIESSGYCGRVA